MCAPWSVAAPADYVETPIVEYGEKEIDFKLGSARKGSAPSESAVSIGYGWGATTWWFTEFILKYKRESGERAKYDAIEWENKFQLTETGKYPLDVAILVELERPNEHVDGWEVKWGPLIQTEIQKLQLNGNVLLQRNHRAEKSVNTTMFYQWQARYRWRTEFDAGLQGFGEVGPWTRWLPADDRKHQIGPAVFGKLRFGDGPSIKYNAAWLLRASKAAPDSNVRMQLEYEF